jgi:hypothetical protein
MMEDSVVRKIREQPSVEVPAIGCSFTTNLGGERQIVLQTHFAQDMSEETINGLLDRMLKIGDRQKAKYDLEKIEEEFRTVGVALTNLLDGFPIAEINHAKEQVERAERLEVLREMQTAARNESYDEFAKAGKRGTFVLKGHALQKVNNIGAEILKLEERERAAANDKQQHRETLLNSVRHYRQDLAKRRVKLNAMRTLAGLPPNTEFEEAETRAVEGL